jgi:DNA invertase Pin-like site-specific DNA recombinase
MESGVEFVAVDNPHANKLTIHVLAAVAEHEREAISERTKAALAAAKAHGKKLGTPPIPPAPSSACGWPARRQATRPRYSNQAEGDALPKWRKADNSDHWCA